MNLKMLFSSLFLITAIASLAASPLSRSQSSQTDGYGRQTSVELTARGSDGQPLPLTRADIYLDIWGDGHLTPLPRARQSVTLRLDQEWLCNAWSEICKSRMYGPARLVLQAEGYAPVTGVVYWPGQQRPGDLSPATLARIELSGGRHIGIEEGSKWNYDIAFRPSAPRIVRIVDETGGPAAGIAMDAWLYFESTNHVGVIEGEQLVRGKTDANGQIAVPDVDGEVAIELQRGRYGFQQPDRVSLFRKVITPVSTTATSTLVIHRFQKQPLNLNFVSRNGNAAGLTLGTCIKFCGGACCGEVASTDAMGQVRIEDFYPEEIDSLYLTDKSGTVLWKGAAPRIGASTIIPTITIPATSR
jgi:hypothetical protein